jgi:hypothetical protein
MKLTFDPEMIEAWMTVEDAVEVASWHMKAVQEGRAPARSGAAGCERSKREARRSRAHWSTLYSMKLKEHEVQLSAVAAHPAVSA